MKKNIIIAAIAAASALLLCASCQKQELIEQNNGINASGKTFTATIEQGLTKTTITSEYKVNWVEGDQIDINGGTTYSATPDASDATKATFTKVSGSDPTPDYTAVYPASLFKNSGYELPATQTYAAGKFNAPMCAMSSTETLEFKNFCGVLCFALKGTDKVKSIAVTANEQLCGPFEFVDATSFSFTGENEGYTVTLDCGEGVQLSSTGSTNFYVYLPPKDSYTAGMKIVVTSTEGKTFEKTTTTAVKIERNNLYTFDWTASFAPVHLDLPGEFSVGATKKVQFSRGNLYWDGDSYEFEANQYTIGTWNAENHVNYFFWSKEESVAKAESYSDASAAASDVFFTNEAAETAKADFTVNGVTGEFRTLSAGEWTYILSTRANAADLLVEDVTVCDVEHCLVIAPDDCLNSYVFDKTKKSYDAADWATAEAAGLICLPPAGYRDGTEIKSGDGNGFYWASTTDAADTASNLGFKKSDN